MSLPLCFGVTAAVGARAGFIVASLMMLCALGSSKYISFLSAIQFSACTALAGKYLSPYYDNLFDFAGH